MAFREPRSHVAKRATDAESILWRHLRNRNFVDTNFDVSIRLAATYWISIVRQKSWRSNWMVAGTTTG